MLDVNNLNVSYGGINAVKGIALKIQAGELVALIGANGAGKSTTLRAIAGLEPIVAGSVHYQGHSITHHPAHTRVKNGMALVPEGRGIFGRLSVEENLQMGAYNHHRAAEAMKNTAELERVYTTFARLKERRKQLAGTLSGGEQQMLAIGRALMSRPKLLLLDEPSMGLAPLMVQKIFATLREISAAGMTILLVEQNAKLALEISSRGYVMESGLIALTGNSRDLILDEKVRHAYLGE